MMFENHWRTLMSMVLILNNFQAQVKVVAQEQTIHEPGINLGDSFFLQKLREGNLSAINDFNNLRQTLTVPENQQKAFANIFQQQNPDHHITLWNMMQNARFHGFPNSHAFDRASFAGQHQYFDNQKAIPFNQLLNLISQAMTRSHNNDVNSQSRGDRTRTENSSTENIGDNVNLSTQTEAPIVGQSSSQSSQILNKAETNPIVGMFENEQSNEGLQSQIKLNDSMKLITRLIKGRIGVPNNIDMFRSTNNFKTKVGPRGYILQFVGDASQRQVSGAADLSPRNTGFVNQEIIGRFWTMPTSLNNKQKNTIQFVGDVLNSGASNSRNTTFSDLNIVKEPVSEPAEFNDLSQTQRQTLQPITNQNTINDVVISDTPKTARSDVFLQFVGDLTGARLLSNKGNNDPLLTRQVIIGDNQRSIPNSAAEKPMQSVKSSSEAVFKQPRRETDSNSVDQTHSKQSNMTSALNRDYVLQKVGNFLADQLTPIDGGLIAFNATDADLLARITETTEAGANNRPFERQTRPMWPKGNGAKSFDRSNDINRNVNSFPMNLVDNGRFPNSMLQNWPNNNQQMLAVENLNSVTAERKQNSLVNTDASQNDDGINSSGDNGNSPDISMIIDLLKSVSSDNGLNKASTPVFQTNNRENGVQQEMMSSVNRFQNEVDVINQNNFVHGMDPPQNPRGTFDPALFTNLARPGSQIVATEPVHILRSNFLNLGRNINTLQLKKTLDEQPPPDPTESSTQSSVKVVQQHMERPIQNSRFQASHKDFVSDIKTKISNPQRINFQLSGTNQTLVQGVKNKPPSQTGIETGFILVNRFFVTDNERKKINQHDGITPQRDKRRDATRILQPSAVLRVDNALPKAREFTDIEPRFMPFVTSRNIATIKTKSTNCKK